MLTNHSTYAIRRALTRQEELLIAKVKIDDFYYYEFFTDGERFMGVPTGPCGNAGMPRPMHAHLGMRWDKGVIVSVSPVKKELRNL